jgi:potassium-transporting ATPase KdpC subunit
MLAQLRAAIVAMILLTIITGLIYPFVVTGIAQALFAHKANGSLIEQEGKVMGSSLIGQAFEDPKYFWSRPSATNPGAPYDASSSTGSNLGPTNPDLTKAITERVAALKEADPDNMAPVPIDLVTTSGSGLDPHISLAAAEYQIPRVARLRNRSKDQISKLVGQHTDSRTFGLLGEPRVNVLELNLALDKLK